MRRPAPALPIESAPLFRSHSRDGTPRGLTLNKKELLSELFSKETLIKSDSAIESAFP